MCIRDRGELRTRLQQNLTHAPLFDSARFRGNLEAAYMTMWERYREGRAPEGFSV